MNRKQRLFVSAVQKEFTAERRALKDLVYGDPLLSRFFEVFLFEDTSASDRRADDVYFGEVDRCSIYVALLGNDYGSINADGLSPTEREFDRATRTNRILERYLPLFGEKYADRFRKNLDEVELDSLKIDNVSVKSSYSNLLTWRHSFAHEGIIPVNATYDEVKKSYQYGCKLLHCLDKTMHR